MVGAVGIVLPYSNVVADLPPSSWRGYPRQCAGGLLGGGVVRGESAVVLGGREGGGAVDVVVVRVPMCW